MRLWTEAGAAVFEWIRNGNPPENYGVCSAIAIRAGAEQCDSSSSGRRPGERRDDENLVRRYGILIPNSFSAASIRCGGSILITSASPVSSRLFRLDRIAGQPVRPPDRMSSLMGRSCDCVSVSRIAVAGGLDLVGHERLPELFDQRRPVDVEGEGEFVRRIAFDHLAADVQRTIGLAHDERAADPQIDLDGKAGEILPAELRRRQCLPYLLRRRGDVDRVDDRGLELFDVHDTPSMPRLERGIASAVPDFEHALEAGEDGGPSLGDAVEQDAASDRNLHASASA